MASVEAELRAEVERLQAENRSLQTALAAAGREQHAALGRERAIVDVLHVIGSSSTDLRAALDAIVQRAAALCRASASRLWLREGDAFAWIASWGETPEARVGEVMSRLVSPELAAVWAEIDQPLHWTLRGEGKARSLAAVTRRRTSSRAPPASSGRL